MAIPKDFKGRAKRLDDVDLPKLGALIGVGEDEIHAVLDVESRGSGFDRLGRPAMLFEPHLFWRELGAGERRDKAVKAGLAYPAWKSGAYPADSYPRLLQAMAIDERAALRSASWGLGQVLGSHHAALGFPTVQQMVAAFCDDEEAHLLAMVRFIQVNHLDDELRRHDWATFARYYNGPGYAKNRYDVRLAAAFSRWKGIRDTKWSPSDAEAETRRNDAILQQIAAEGQKRPATSELPIPAPAPAPDPAPARGGSLWADLLASILALFRRPA